MICQIAVASLLLPAVCMAQGYTVTTVVGTGTTGFSGDGGPANSATLYYPADVAVDAKGNIYVASTGAGMSRLLYKGMSASR